MEEKKIIVNGIAVSYLCQIKKSSQIPLVFLHGWRSESVIWINTMNRFSTEKRSLFALDLPGFGKSEVPKETYSIQRYADGISEFLHMNTIEKAHIVGHSFGGRIAIRLASQNPKTVATLTLVDSAGIRKPSTKRSLVMHAAKIAKLFFRLPFLSGIRSKIYFHLGADDYLETPHLQKTFVAVVSEDLSKDISSIHVPTLIYWGKDDRQTLLSMGKEMHGKIKNSEFVVDRGDHFAFVENSENFTKILKQFIAKHE